MTVVQKLGCVSYAEGLRLQAARATARESDTVPDTLYLLEHPPTVTLGKRSGESDLLLGRPALESRGVEVVPVGRGGRATYHGPGQLVGYPIVRLASDGRGVRRFVGGLARLLAEAARGFGADARADLERTGVFVGGAKLASIGIEVHRGVARHGFALNVDMDLTPFAAIVPCGVPGLMMTDLARAAGRAVTLAEAADAVLAAWAREFGEIREERVDEQQHAD